MYAGLTVAVLGVYVGAVWALGRFFGRGVVVVVAGGVVALLLVRLRDRCQQAVARLVFGDRDNPYQVLSRLGRIDTADPPRQVMQEVADTIARSLHLPFAAIDVAGPDGRFEPEAAVGTPAEPRTDLALRHGGEHIGWLHLSVGSGREPFGEGDHRLLNELSRHTAAVVHAVRLTLALQRSRERLVVAREEERRRIRRDLHDGLGPALASAVWQTEAATGWIRGNPDQAEAVLGGLSGNLQQAVGNLGRLVHGLRPPALDNLGLAAAIEERAVHFSHPGNAHTAGHGLRVTVKSGELGPLPAAVEYAAYNIAVEAVTNAARHADASICVVTLRMDGALYVEIRDDGRGLSPVAAANVGLASMRERAAELGGTLTVTSTPQQGTVVHARLPLRPW